MRRTGTFISFLLAALLVMGAVPKRKTPRKVTAFVSPLQYICAATDTSGWKSSGGALDIEVDYWAEGNCTAQATGKPGAAGAPLLTGPARPAGPLRPPVRFPGVVIADFDCQGTGGKCYFRVRKVTTPTVTNTTTIEKTTVGWECQKAKTETIFDEGRCDVLVRVTAPKNCTASVSADGGTAVTFTDTEKFVSFGQARRITALCEGPSGSGRCKFEVRAWCL